MMTVSRLIPFLVAALCIAGLWQLGMAGSVYAKALVAEQLIQNAWQDTLKGHSNVRPWPWADTWPVAEIRVPRLNIQHIVLSGDSGRILAFGPGLTQNQTLPGEAGVSVISGHRDTNFRFLKDIKLGEKIIIKNSMNTRSFTVKALSVVDQRTAQINTDQHTETASLVLVTCYPFDALVAGGDLRFIVEASADAVN